MPIKKSSTLLCILIGITACTLTISASITSQLVQQPFHPRPMVVPQTITNHQPLDDPPRAQLTITKDDGKGLHGFIYPNDPYQYNITFGNPTQATVHNVQLVDHLDTKLTFVTASHGGIYIPQTRKVYWNFTSLNPGQMQTVTLLVFANNGTSGTTIYNTATIYSSETDPNNASDTTLVWEGNKPITTIEIGQPQYSPDLMHIIQNTPPQTPCDCEQYTTTTNTNQTYYRGLLTGGESLPPGQEFTGRAPTSWDWRTANYNGITADWTTPIKNQGMCGSCYAFGSYAALESIIKLQTNNPTLPIDLSEQFMVSCGTEWTPGINGCYGATQPAIYSFLENHGAIPEPCFPYTSGYGYRPPCADKCGTWQSQQLMINSWHTVAANQNSIKNALIQYGPLVAGMVAYDDFDTYTGGVYIHPGSEPDPMNHCVTIVGYDDTQNCWICKNSWGTSWGENGWFKIAYGECKIEQAVVYLTYTSTMQPDLWINHYTPIWLNATDDFAGVKELHYTINAVHYIVNGNTTMFHIPTECEKNLEYWAVDYFNNIENKNNKTLYVDNTPPLITVETGEPSYNQFIGRNTPVWLNVTDQGCLGGVGINNLTYQVYRYLNGNWVYQYGATVVDNDQNDSNPAFGEITLEYHFNESCQHQIRYWAYDLLTNREPTNGYQSSIFFVDADGPEVTINFGEPNNPHFRYHNNQWYTGIGPATPVILHAVDQGCQGGVGAEFLTYEVYTATTYGAWEFYYQQTVQDNHWPDMNPLEGSITIGIFMDESCWHQLHYWAYDKLENRNPVNPSSYEQTEFLVDAETPTTTGMFVGPQYLDPVDEFMWITNQTKKHLTITDTGCNPQGSGVYVVDWWVTKKINGDWVIVDYGTVFDNDINDTDGTPAYPWQGHQGGLWAHDYLDRPFTFQDQNQNGSLDENENVLSVDPDKDGYHAIPHSGDQGGLYSLDTFQEPFIFNDSNQNFIYDEDDYILYINPDHDNIPAVPQLYSIGGYYAFDNTTEPYTFIDLNTNWIYDVNQTGFGEPIASLKPDADGVGTIHTNITIHEDCEHHIYHQATDVLGNVGPEHKEYVRADNTPPTTINITGTPRYYYYDDDAEKFVYCITPQTPITLRATDHVPPCAVGIDYFHYEIWYNNTKTLEKNVTIFNEETFTMQGECIHELYWYAVDLLGNQEPLQNQTYRVDDTPPQIEVTQGQPIIPMQDHSWVNKSTPITISAINPGCCPFFTVQYRLNRGTWHYITHQLPYTFTFPDECIYELDIMASDVVNHVDRVIDLYYVDDTPPQNSIIKPVDGWYTMGSPIPAILPAIDEPNHSTPCHDELAVGISLGHTADAFLLDAFPSFQTIILDGQNCIYDSSQQKFIGNLIIPQTIPFDNGPVLFGTQISDDLGNTNDILAVLYQLFLQAAGNENTFTQLIQPLLQNHLITYVGIDKTPPSITIQQPQPGAMIGPNPVEINALMHDALSGISTGAACHVSVQGILIGILQYDPDLGGCSGTLPLPGNIQSGEDLPFTLTIADAAGNIGEITILVDVTTLPMNTPPVGFIRAPVENGMYETVLSVMVEAHDEETPPPNLEVIIEITRQNDPPFTYPTTYDYLTNNFTTDINISSYTNGAMLQINAYVTDTDGNTILTLPVHCYVISNIIFDQWMDNGWNTLNLPTLGTNKTIEHVFRSLIHGNTSDFDYIFDSNSWDNYKFGRPVNTLTTAQAGIWYWVNTINPNRFYLTETG